jgi:hypothetical protein
VQTDWLQPGPDSDRDGLPDDWEREHGESLRVLSGAGDNDEDGFTNQEEYVADTNPLSASSNLRITGFSADRAGTVGTITWLSRPTRQYFVRLRNALETGNWVDSGLGLIPGDGGTSTTRTVTAERPELRQFFAVEAVRALAP